MRTLSFLALFVCIILCVEGLYFLAALSLKPEIQKADLISVFAGGPGRVNAGLELAKEGYAPCFTISHFPDDLTMPQENKKKIEPDFSIIVTNARSTFQDALYTKDIMRKRGFKSVILVTSSIHMPRAFFLLRAVLALGGEKIFMIPVQGNELKRRPWYRSYQGIVSVLNEMGQFWGSLFEGGLYALGCKG